jgi:hypothetical protein
MPSQRSGAKLKRPSQFDAEALRPPKTCNSMEQKSAEPDTSGPPTIELAISDAERKLFATLFGGLIDQTLAELD